MQKLFTLCLLIGSIQITTLCHAVQLPKVLERGVADNILDTGGSFARRCKKSGNIHLLFIDNGRHAIKSLNSAIPLWRDDYSLCKLEAQFGKLSFSQQLSTTHKKELNISKVGLSGRHIFTPGLMLGVYGFCDFIDFVTHSKPIKRLFNGGVELIAPRYAILTVDTVFDPSNLLFPSVGGRLYQIGTRLSVAKPRIIDIGVGTACTKYVRNRPRWHMMVDCKGSLPIKKWGLNKHFLGGFGLVYDKQSHLSWNSTKNLKISMYVQIDMLRQKSKNALCDYLKMPIDRPLAVPYHPGLNPFRVVSNFADYSRHDPMSPTDDYHEYAELPKMHEIPPEPETD